MSRSQAAPPAKFSLVETVPTPVVQSALRDLRWRLIWTYLAFCCILTLLVARDAEVGWRSAIVVGIGLFILGTFMSMGLVAVMRHELGIRIPTVELRQDELTVRYGKRELNANVKDCRLRRGRAYMMHLPGCPRLNCSQSVILLDFPRATVSKRMSLLWGSKVRVAVGYTDEMLSDWEQALSVAYESTTHPSTDANSETDES